MENLKKLKEAAEQGYAQAQFNLGVMYAKGEGVTQDYDEAAKWIHKAAGQGDAQAQVNLGVMYAKGEGVKQDYKEAEGWFHKAAGQGHAQAQVNLGVMYANGEGVTQDYKEAEGWFHKAAEQGHAQAQVNLGVMYAKGEGVKQDYKEAEGWFHKAAGQGHAQAQVNLGVMYANGEGVKQDYNEAAVWFRKAAEQGHAQAQCNIGVMYAMGLGVSQDGKKAEEWLSKAAEQGYAQAQQVLQAMHNKDKPQEKIDKRKRMFKFELSELHSIESNLDFVTFYSDDKDFSTLSSNINKTIKSGYPELAISNLHTFTIKFLKEICDDNQIQYSKKVTLYKLFQKYLDFKKNTESKIPEQISGLASCILNFFNTIRNNRSSAHDNPLLKKDEALFVCKSIINLLVFLKKIEKLKA